MSKKRNIKQTLIISVLSFVICITMFIGTTFAWFTDNVESKNNIIKSGNLDLEMYWTDDLNSDVWHNVEDEAYNTIFNYDNWEPGYTEVKYIKLVNKGNLALNYKLALTPTGEVGKLAEVINVFYANAKNGVEVKSRENLSDMKSIGLLKNAMNGRTTANGTLLAASQQSPIHTSGETIVTLAMNMITTAGNDYQNESIGDGFTITALATQCAYEEDGFGSDYDSSAEYPEIIVPGKVSVSVTPDNGKVPAGGVTLAGDGLSAIVPEGVALKDGAKKLTLTVKPLENTTTDITVVNNEILIPVDVHIEGVAEDNTVPIIINLGAIMPKYLNMGNYTLIHVEDGTNNSMTYVAQNEEFTDHNQFKYDSDTGEVSVAMASFSEVAVVADTANPWNGELDYDLTGTGTETEPYVITSADELAGFGAIVGGMNGQKQTSYMGKYVKLIADINLGANNDAEGHIFYPIGYYNSTGSYKRTTDTITSDINSFEGYFDGDGHTIYNFYQNTWAMFGDYNTGYSAGSNYYKDAMGLFGYVKNGRVENLTVDNFSSDGEFTPTGVIAAYAVNSTFENIAITNCTPRVYNTGNGGIVGIGGNSDDPDSYKLTFTNVTIDNSNTITALWGSWDVACGGLVGMFRGAGHVYMTNCHVAAKMDVYNDVCGNYQYYWYRYSGMMVGTNKNMTTDANGYTVPETDKFHAEGCTVHFGDWNDYYYCELVANSLASYTHDHQFSRLEVIDSLGEISDDNGATWKKTGNFLLFGENGKQKVSGEGTCYHIIKDANGNLYQHKHDVADDTNKEIYETVNGVQVLKENNQRIYLPFNQLFTGYGWGVKHIPVYNGENYTFAGITILDREVADSVTKFKTKFTNDYLYRVGNKNAVSVGSLFDVEEEFNEDSTSPIKVNKNSSVHVTVEKVDKEMAVSGAFQANSEDWTKGTIKFTGTGVVKVTIQDYNFCTPTVLYLEVVDATNVTTASFSGNSVLLNDVSTSSTLSTSGIIYGNGFTVNMENAPITEKNGAVFHLYDGAILKNLGIVGKEFTTVATNVNDTNYGVSTVRTWGTVVIENCYISGCRAPISVTGTELTIKDSVIANGVYANVDFRSGILNLHNVTTINEPHSVNGTTVVGLGIVGNMTASAGRKLNITGSLTQYNWVSKDDCANIKASGVDSIFNSVFTDDKYASLRYTYNGTTYVNTGILSLCNDFGGNATTGRPSIYEGMDVEATISGVSVNGYVWAPAQASTLTADDMKYHDNVYEWTSNNQSSSFVPGAFDFSNSGLTTVDSVVQIEYESGSSYTLTASTLQSLLSTEKYGKLLDCKVSMNGTDYTGKDITFDATTSQTYTITYSVTDNLIYNKNGELTGKAYEITKKLKVFATVVDKSADAPTFTFYYGTNGSASASTPHATQPQNSYSSTIKQVGEAYYIMPNVSKTTSNAIGSETVGGETVYYPIVDGINVRSGSSMDYDFTRYYPIFKAVKISDNGTEYSYSGTKEMPATVAWVSATIDSGNGASALNDGFGLYNNQYLCKIQKKAGDAEGGGTSVVKFSYTALDGNTYYYYVGYRFYNEDEGGVCVTPDTLVTLADGSAKRIDEVSYDDKLLVWNFYDGKYDVAPIAIIFDHGADNNTVIKLTFSDGTMVKVVNMHQFFDSDLNQLVTISKDSVEDYVGHKFAKYNGNGTDFVELVSYSVSNEYVEAWGIMSAEHYNIITEGMISYDFELKDVELFNYFEVGEDMRFDETRMQTDIEKYGLYTYEDFAAYLTYEQFIAFNVQYFKIPVGKGLYTYEGIIKLIEQYLN